MLQPQHFANSTFATLTFTSTGNDTITIFPGRRGKAQVLFMKGENSLSGLPTRYFEYNISYVQSAKPTTENIDSILQWQRARKISIRDQDDVAISLTQRTDELKKLQQLSLLDLYMQHDTYDKLTVATFIQSLESLDEISFTRNNMTDAQMKEFEATNTVPPNWRSSISGECILYKRYAN